MSPTIRYARNGEVSIAYETFGDPAAEPLLLIMGLDFQMVWWPDAFCRLLAESGFAVARFDNRDTGLSTHFTSPARQNPFLALAGRTPPVYTAADMRADALAVMDALGWPSAHVFGGSMGAALAQGLALTAPHRVRSLVSAMGLPADAGVLETFRYLRYGVFLKLGRIRSGGTREQQIDNLVRIFRAIASPGYPFPEEWPAPPPRPATTAAPATRRPPSARWRPAARSGCRRCRRSPRRRS